MYQCSRYPAVLAFCCFVAAGCGKSDADANLLEQDAVKAWVQMNSEYGVAGTTDYLSYEAASLDDGQVRVVRCVMQQGEPPQLVDRLFKLKDNHAVDWAENPAGDNWRSALDQIAWQGTMKKDGMHMP